MPDPRKGKKSLIRDILDGSILTREGFVSHLSYFIFLTVLGLFYIGNRYHSEKILRHIIDENKQLKDARSESVLTSSKLMKWKNQSKIYDLVNKKDLKLKPLKEAPGIIYIND